jgi:hypothetical protein
MKTMATAFAFTILFAAGCAKESEAPAPAAAQPAPAAANLTPEQLGELGAKITRQPDNAQQILSQHGLSEEAFEQAIRKVSEDPAASKRYAAGFHRASV